MKRPVRLLAAGAIALLPLASCSPAAVVPTAATSTGATGHDKADRQPVTKVVDGDTFDTPEGRVRVLVMDSCEKGTRGGTEATADAHRLLDGQTVILVMDSHASVDRDRYGRLLRYVLLPDGSDYARTMLAKPHTGVYAKTSDASPAELAEGRAADVDGRSC